jgi:hypothetical protein
MSEQMVRIVTAVLYIMVTMFGALRDGSNCRGCVCKSTGSVITVPLIAMHNRNAPLPQPAPSWVHALL